MSLFPKNSAFDRSGYGAPIDPNQFRVPSKPKVGATKPPDATEVPISVLERWYAALNEVDLHGVSRAGDPRTAHVDAVADRLEELRDEVYSYLRG